MRIKAKGQLRHRFHGDYSVVIVLVFGSEEEAALALTKLTGWSASEKTSKCLVWSGDSEELEVVSDVLEGYGAERRKIASLRYSIDYGEPFEVEIELPEKNQMTLF